VPADGSRLRTFTAHSPDSVLILGPRRYPAIPSPLANSNTKLAICTSVGFRQIDVDEYVIAGGELRPDIFLAPGDLVTDHKPSQKRVEKMGDRTAAWLRDATALKEAATERGQQFALFAPILPVPLVMQSWYLKELVEDFKHRIDGLYVHDAHSVVDLPESIQSLPRLAFSAAAGPSELLDQISLGVDLFITSFTGSATDAGIALTFSFPAPSSGEGGDGSRKAIGVDMWDTKHATDVSPFGESCECCACQKHHRAFLHHLLSAKEMLAWVLLQIHNHHVMEQFFAAVHTSITNGTFEKGRKAFDRYYEPELLITAGKGPRYVRYPLLRHSMLTIYRVRGYQVKSVGRGEPKKNVKAFNKLDDMAEALAEAKAPSPDVDAEQLEDHGLGKTQRA
jgi:queuine tRNA-ribosyltransferase subunit QTRTD1